MRPSELWDVYAQALAARDWDAVRAKYSDVAAAAPDMNGTAEVIQLMLGELNASHLGISGNLPTDFGFPIAVHAHEPETVYVVPITSDSEHYVHDGRLRVYRSRTGGDEWQPLTSGLPQANCYVNVLRDAMAVDRLESCGVYFGTSGGQVYGSADGGDNWSPIVRDLPAVLSVEVQTLP